MKILIISQYFWPENFRINDLAFGLKERGHEVTVITGLPNYPKGKFFDGYGFSGPYTEIKDGIRIVRVPMIPRGSKKGLQLALNFFSFSFLASFIVLFRCREKYDASLVWNISPVTTAFVGIVLKWFRGIPVYNWVADLWPDTLTATGVAKKGLALSLVSKLAAFIYRHCSVNLIASAGYEKRLLAMGIAKEKIVYWPQWAETIYSQPPKGDPIPWPNPTGFKILYAGNIGASQGFETIVEAATLLKDEKHVHWVILGDGVLKDWVTKQVRERGLEEQVHFLDPCPVEKMPEYAVRADALLASLRDDPLFEITVPGKLQSCLALGKPILASLSGEASKIVTDSGAGLVAKSGDHMALAKAAKTMAALSHQELQKMGQAGRSYFKAHFERQSLFEKLEKLIVSRQS